MSARWAPGTGYAVVAGHGAALLDEDLGAGVAEALLVLLSTPQGAAQALDAIVGARGGRMSALPSFGLVQRGQDEDRVLVRGSIGALVDGTRLDADADSPWMERRVPAGHAVVLESADGEDLGPGTEYLPLLGGVVRAGGLGLAAGPLPSTAPAVLPVAAVIPEGRSGCDAVADAAGTGAVTSPGAGGGPGVPTADSGDVAVGPANLDGDLREVSGETISWSTEDEAIASGMASSHAPDAGQAEVGPAGVFGHDAEELQAATTPDDGLERVAAGTAPTGATRLAQVIGAATVGTTTSMGSTPQAVASLLSLVCAAGHPNPPDALSCSRCPAPLVPPVQVVAQPVLARLAVSTGDVVDLLGEVVIGRAPRRPDPAIPSRLVAVPSPGHLISRSHLIISTQGWSVLATDLGSNNGTVLVRAGTEPVLLGRRLPTPLVMGDLLDLGEGVTIRLVPPL